MEPTREEIDRTPGLVVVEFGAEWCPHCQAAQPDVAAQLAAHPAVRHIKVEDGKGKPLGRSFRVKLWPTLVFLKDGAVVEQLVRPSADEIAKGFAQLAG
jgi:thioredoxin 1